MIIGSVIIEQQMFNGVYDQIRQMLVQKNHLPDRAMFTNKADYDAAVQILKTAGNTIIEVKNYTSGLDRQKMFLDTIYINKIGTENGDYGMRKAVFTSVTLNNQTTFKKVMVPKPQDINIEISYQCNNTTVEQLIAKVLDEAIGQRNYLHAKSNDGTAVGGFWIFYNGTVNVDTGKTLDRRARYTAKDLIISSPIVVQENIPPMSVIEPIIGPDEVSMEFPNE